MADETTKPPTSAIVPVKSAWNSRINWTQLVGLLAMLAAVWGVDVDAETQATIVTLIASAQAILTWVMRTWFSDSVTAATVGGAPVVSDQASVGQVTPPGKTVTTVYNG